SAGQVDDHQCGPRASVDAAAPPGTVIGRPSGLVDPIRRGAGHDRPPCRRPKARVRIQPSMQPATKVAAIVSRRLVASSSNPVPVAVPRGGEGGSPLPLVVVMAPTGERWSTVAPTSSGTASAGSSRSEAMFVANCARILLETEAIAPLPNCTNF